MLAQNFPVTLDQFSTSMENVEMLPLIQGSIADLLNSVAIPQRVLLSVFGFLAIINVASLRVCLDTALKQIVTTAENDFEEKCQSNNLTSLSTRWTRISEEFEREFNCTAEPPWSQKKRKIVSLPALRAKLKEKLDRRHKKQSVLPSQDSYKWSKRTQTSVVSAFYIGYVLSHIPGGLLAQRYGGKWVLALSIMSAAILTLATPFTIRHGGPAHLIILRVVIGFCEGPAFPALSSLLSHWVPPNERGKLGAFALSGGQVGIVVVNIISTFVLHLSQWPMIFYFFGGCALIWSLCFILLCSDEPATDPFITSSECRLLQESISNINPDIESVPIPWKQILFNIPVWAMISSAIQYNWTQAQSMAITPQLIKTVEEQSFGQDICASVKASLPHFISWCISLASGSICDVLIENDIVSTTDMRRLMAAITAFGPKLFNDLGSCFSEIQHDDFVAKANCAIGVMGSFYAGAKLTPLDLSRNYSGILMAISNGVGSLAAILLPHLEEVFPNSSLYRNLRSTLCLFSAMLTSGDVQDFDNAAAASTRNPKNH